MVKKVDNRAAIPAFDQQRHYVYLQKTHSQFQGLKPNESGRTLFPVHFFARHFIF